MENSLQEIAKAVAAIGRTDAVRTGLHPSLPGIRVAAGAPPLLFVRLLLGVAIEYQPSPARPELCRRCGAEFLLERVEVAKCRIDAPRAFGVNPSRQSLHGHRSCPQMVEAHESMPLLVPESIGQGFEAR
jgi:hypothetical protein